MARPGWVAPLFTFTTPPVSALTLVVFISILFSSVFFYEELPHIPQPSHQHGLNLDEAYRDLQFITSSPHPYNSHQNNVVRSFLLDRLRDITRHHSNIRIEDDQITNVTIAKGQAGSYFEGNNLLVHIQGTSAMPAVLFSAHFDSVSTAPGTTDDAMGVVTLLQLVKYFTDNQPKRDVLFNINNAEEDGLYGAIAFMAHPWSSLPTSFLNLEGAGSGGRALLFRTSSISVAKAFKSVPHPHGNVITENAFQRGSVRSDTDFTVYTKYGIPGLDLAFYKRRAIYHTKDDSIPSLGGKASLWNMLESAFFAGKTLAGDGSLDDKSENKAVYFDLFGETLVVASLRTFFVIDLVLLIVGPISVAIMIFFAYRRSKIYWSRKGWLRSLIAIVFSAAVPVGLAFLINWSNPFVVYDAHYSLLAMQLSAAFIFLYLPLRILAHYRPIFRQKTIVLFELYVITWALLVFNTILVSGPKIGGFYAVTFLHAGLLFSLLLGLAEHFELPPSVKKRLVKHVRRDSEGEEHEGVLTEEATERTPLLDREEEEVRDLAVDEENQYVLWIFQFLLAAPFPMILLIQFTLLLLGSLRHTLSDGSPSLTVYLGVGALSFLSVLPLAPFVHKLHRSLLGLAILVLIISTLINIFAFPFSDSSPLKVFFQQTVDLDTGDNKVMLAGVMPFLKDSIIPELPSAVGAEVKCEDGRKFKELKECFWEGIPPAVVPGSLRNWIAVNTSLVRPGYGRISLEGVDTRFCNIYFHSPVNNIQVKGSSGKFLEQYPMPPDGLISLRLWSRTYDRKFQVDFGWDGGKHLSGKVGCVWDEKIPGRIPAFDEVIAFLPTWATVTKYTSGLVEVTKSFTI